MLLNGRSAADDIVKAVDDVSFSIEKGKIFGLLGESGCGKTTLARTLLRLTEPTSGTVTLDGLDVFALSAEQVRATLRSRARMIFQHPDAVMNPAYTVSMILDQALRVHTNIDRRGRRERARALLQEVELPSNFLNKYSGELSGGQKRRIGICRALATEPEVIVADEPFSGLDVSLQEHIVDLFREVQRTRGLTVLLISHDVGLVTRLCDRVGIMRKGALVEVLADPRQPASDCDHPYAESLLNAHLNVRNAP